MKDNYRKSKISALLAVVAVFICCYAKNATAQPAPFQTLSAAIQKQLSSAQDASGIKVVRVTYAVGGMKLDLRYKVTDLKKAQQILTNKTPVSLIDQATGKVLKVPNMPKVGKLSQSPTQNETWRVYWMMFDNPGVLVKKGGKVTLVLGDVKIKDIIVE